MKNVDIPIIPLRKRLLQILMVLAILPFQLSANGTSESKEDSNPTKYLQYEICDNRIDDDGDGLVDCLDPDCYGVESCWECVTEFYQVHSNQYLVSLDPASGTYTSLGQISGATEINGAQFNHVDGHVYAPCKIDGQHVLGRLHQNGDVVSTGLVLPGNGIFYVGAIDAAGTMYVSNSGGIYSIDLTAPILEAVSTGVSNPSVADFALDLTRGLFYGITGSAKLKVFDPYTLQISTYDLAGSINSDSGGYGAAWSSNDGSFFAYNNSSGKIYSVDVNNLTATLVLNATGNLSINDGFNCVLAPPPFETNCTNGIDDDGDGLVDCDDPDCAASNECTVEICDNGIDDDGDGWIDCSDSECYNLSFCVEICDNGIDDNGNGLIDGDDPQCTTSSGVTGGLESNRRLSDKIANRNFYTQILEPEVLDEMLKGDIPFTPSLNKSLHDISTYIPEELEDAYIAESTPIDLIDITNATDVAAADYYLNNQRIASVLAIYSEDGVYEHSKYICDRLDGSRLLDISYLFSKGGNFISYELLNKYGQAEYAVSFSARLDEQDKFRIENHWNLHKYNEDENYFNFQIWAKSYVELIILLENILDKMEDVAGIESIETSNIPSTFVMHGNYENGALELQIKNKSMQTKLYFNASVRKHEGGDLEYIQRIIPLEGKNQENIVIETGHLYDLGASLDFENSSSDEIFLADGMWGIDVQEENGEVYEFVTAQDQRTSIDDGYQVERSISVTGRVKNYFNVFRSLDAKFKPFDLDDYNSLSFNASGNVNLQVTIVKASIDKWEDQFRTNITLRDTEELYALKKEHFVSDKYDILTLEDVTTIVFTILGDNQQYQDVSLDINEVSFKNAITTNVLNIENDEKLSFSPNPAKDFLNFSINSEYNGTQQLSITNSYGVEVLNTNINVSPGRNNQKIDISELENGCYVFFLKDGSGNMRTGKFIKVD